MACKVGYKRNYICTPSKVLVNALKKINPHITLGQARKDVQRELKTRSKADKLKLCLPFETKRCSTDINNKDNDYRYGFLSKILANHDLNSDDILITQLESTRDRYRDQLNDIYENTLQTQKTTKKSNPRKITTKNNVRNSKQKSTSALNILKEIMPSTLSTSEKNVIYGLLEKYRPEQMYNLKKKTNVNSQDVELAESHINKILKKMKRFPSIEIKRVAALFDQLIDLSTDYLLKPKTFQKIYLITDQKKIINEFLLALNV